MRNNILIGLFSLLFTTFATAVPEIQEWETKTGAKVLFIEAHELPMVDIEVVFDAGAARDGDKPGLAVMTNALLSEGTQTMSAQQIAQSFESVGAQFSNDSARDMSFVKLRSLSDPKFLQPSLKTFNDVIVRPGFGAKSVELIRSQLATSLKAKKQSPGDIASDTLMATMYKDHPYGSPEQGTEDSIAAISNADILAFYKKYFVAKNATIAIIGDLSLKDAKRISASVIKGLPQGEAAYQLPPVAKPAASVVTIEYDSEQTHLLMGIPMVQRGNKDFWPLYVGNQVLGGSGLVSIISQEVREKRGLAYSAGSYVSQMRMPGPFIVSAQTRAEQSGETREVIVEVLREFVDKGPTEEQLSAAKSNLTSGFPMRIDSNSKMLGYLAMIGFYDLPRSYLNDWQANVEKVNVSDVQAAYERYLNFDEMTVVIVGPETK